MNPLVVVEIYKTAYRFSGLTDVLIFLEPYPLFLQSPVKPLHYGIAFRIVISGPRMGNPHRNHFLFYIRFSGTILFLSLYRSITLFMAILNGVDSHLSAGSFRRSLEDIS